MNFVNKCFCQNIKIEIRFLSNVYKSKKQIFSADQKLVNDNEDNDITLNKQQKPTKYSRTRRGKSFMEHYEGNSIGSVNYTDERFAGAIIKARSISENNNYMVLEGINIIRDAIKMNGTIVTLYFSDRELLNKIPYTGFATDAMVYYVRYRDLKKVSNLATPPGILAIVKRPNAEDMLYDAVLSKKLPLTLILDRITDAGNLGTIIRTAAGFNVHKVLLTEGCVDAYSDRVLRGSMASVFSVPIFEKLSWTNIMGSLPLDCTVHSLSMPTNGKDSFQYDHRHLIHFNRSTSYGLVVPDTGKFLSPEAESLCEDSNGSQIIVPTVNGKFTLNCALTAGIVMGQFQREFLASL